MEKMLFVIVLLCLGEQSVLAQQTYTPVRFYLRPSVGKVLPITSYRPGYITDDLISLQSGKAYFQPFAMGFYYRNFGVEGSFSLTPDENPDRRYQRIHDRIDGIYGGQYIIEITQNHLYTDTNEPGDPIVRGSIGPTYKYEKGRWLLFGRAKIGLVSVTTGSLNAALKGKGSNDRLRIDLVTDSPTKDFFAMNPSAAIGYRLGKKLALEMEIGSWIYKRKIDYTENTTNINLENFQSVKYSYSNLMCELTMGIGLIVIFR